MESYFLSGINNEHILVFRTEDEEDILRVITRLAASRDKEIKGLAKKLELSWYERQHEKDNNKNETGRVESKTRPQNGSKGKNSRGN